MVARRNSILLSTQLFPGVPVLEVEQVALDLGYDGLELMLPPKLSDKAYGELALTLDQVKTIQRVHASTWTFGRDKFEASLKQATHLATLMGAGLVVIHPPALKYSDVASREEMYELVRHSYQNFGCAASLEVLTRPRTDAQGEQQAFPLPTQWLYEMITKFLPVTLDTTHLGAWGTKPLSYAKNLQSSLQHVHISDFQPNPHLEHMTVGTGKLPLAKFLRGLIKLNYQGAVTVELSRRYIEAGFATAVAAARDSRLYIQNALS